MNRPGRRRFLFFDWAVGGHHSLYMERIAQSLPEGVMPVFAAPTPTAAHLAARGLEVLDLGTQARTGVNRHFRRDTAQLASAEVGLFHDAIEASRAELGVHLFADGVLRQLALTRPFRAPTAILLFRPRAHYGALYGTPLSLRDRVLAQAYEVFVQLWRRRPDSCAVLTLDEGAASRWAKRPGADAFWFPEPPVLATVQAPRDRKGAIVYGSLAPRKGLDLLAAAAAVPGRDLSITLAGDVVPSFEEEFAQVVAQLRGSGVTLTLLASRQEESAGLALLAAARCAVLPYVSHYGMSRVLLEAAHTGTPIVANRHGLLGHLVEKYGLGASVDGRSPRALRQAIDSLCHDDHAWQRSHTAASAFAARYAPERFRQILAECLQ